MSFIDINLKDTYRTGQDDLLNDFYLPALGQTKNYDRAVGYFSSNLLVFALKGVSAVIENKGLIRLIVGHPVSDEEYAALQEGYGLRELSEVLKQELNKILNVNSDIEKYRLRLFSMLVATGKLEIKFALRRPGMYHEKLGIMEDLEGNKLVFQGSANETLNAINPDLNYESLSVYRSWEKDIFDRYAAAYIKGFEDIWNGSDSGIKTLDMPSDLYQIIHKSYVEQGQILFDKEIEKELEVACLYAHNNHYPLIPKTLNGVDFKIFDHQRTALQAWFSHGKKGILRLATGSGKTITSMYGISKIFENSERPRKIFFLVAVPYVALAEQWVKELAMFNMQPIKCFLSRDEWAPLLNNKISNLLSGNIEFFSAVVVNKTMMTESFQNIIKRVSPENIFFVGDECHRHGSELISSKLPLADVRLGLSATPFLDTELDEYGEELDGGNRRRLTAYYGDIVAKYDLVNALVDKVLTPYNYHLVKVVLTERETELYIEYSKDIGRLSAMGNTKDNVALSNAIRKRNKIISNAENKLLVLDDLLKKEDFDTKSHTLFYVGEGKADIEDDLDLCRIDYGDDLTQLEKVAHVVRRNGWKVSRFTARENKSDRKLIMDSFIESSIDGLVSMRVLDEGIDLPKCQRAFILASSRNPRQFIQRRGRILRRSPGKERAEIFDFLVVADPVFKEKNIISLAKNELERAMDFVRLADNRKLVEAEAQKIAEIYNIDLNEV